MELLSEREAQLYLTSHAYGHCLCCTCTFRLNSNLMKRKIASDCRFLKVLKQTVLLRGLSLPPNFGKDREVLIETVQTRQRRPTSSWTRLELRRQIFLFMIKNFSWKFWKSQEFKSLSILNVFYVFTSQCIINQCQVLIVKRDFCPRCLVASKASGDEVECE